jgi:cvfA/B/C family virulence factor
VAKYQVMFWKHIPSQIKAWDEGGETKRMLPDRFQVAIDAFAMKDGSTDMDAYLEGWAWGPVEEREGPAKDVLESVASEIDTSYPRSRLMQTETHE